MTRVGDAAGHRDPRHRPPRGEGATRVVRSGAAGARGETTAMPSIRPGPAPARVTASGREARPGVQRHRRPPHSPYGYVAKIPLPGGGLVAGLADAVAVRTGGDADSLGPALALAGPLAGRRAGSS